MSRDVRRSREALDPSPVEIADSHEFDLGSESQRGAVIVRDIPGSENRDTLLHRLQSSEGSARPEILLVLDDPEIHAEEASADVRCDANSLGELAANTGERPIG